MRPPMEGPPHHPREDAEARRRTTCSVRRPSRHHFDDAEWDPLLSRRDVSRTPIPAADRIATARTSHATDDPVEDRVVVVDDPSWASEAFGVPVESSPVVSDPEVWQDPVVSDEAEVVSSLSTVAEREAAA